MCTLLCLNAAERVGAEPDIGAPVGRRHGCERDVDDESEGAGGVGEVGVRVGWLCEGRGGQGSVAGDEGELGEGAEVGGG